MNKLLIVCTVTAATLYVFKNDLTTLAQNTLSNSITNTTAVQPAQPLVVDIKAMPTNPDTTNQKGAALTEQIVITPQEVGEYSELEGGVNTQNTVDLAQSEQVFLNKVQSSFAEKSLFLYSFECKQNDCNAGIVATDGQPKHEDIAGVLADLSASEEFANHSVQLAGVAVNNDGILQYDLNIKNMPHE
ncbi:hypothetical protein PspMM1_32420 [Pseudoalteromonas sp. MM1]|jgi:hypothetical protein|uniref:hypothetical protein n=1 Tax=Pseudoalteromonas sp. MM1 TaxID=3036714 RepID=UPI0025726AFC|nr:hypothetical protein [Pseudoalteromonas sp. MM1]BED90774.1 hypothetical protein PspMM1_32420 [Pseudoalteromonas sp. MM1]